MKKQKISTLIISGIIFAFFFGGACGLLLRSLEYDYRSFSVVKKDVSSFDLAEDVKEQVIVYASDAIERRMLDDLKGLYEWTDEKIFFSEVGVPYGVDDKNYSVLIDKFFAVINAYDSHVALWAVGEYWEDYTVAPYIPDSLDAHGFSAVFDHNAQKNDSIRALNLAGAEFGLDADAVGEVGRINQTYYYHDKSDLWEKIAAKGYTHVRFPIRLERLFDLDTGTWQRRDREALERALLLARESDLQVIFDIHNYGAVQRDGEKINLGEDDFSVILYQELLVEISRFAHDHRDVISMIGLMNEPKNVSPKEWEVIAQRALGTLRDAGWVGLIEVPTGNWQGVQDVVEIHDEPWINDPLDNFVYGVHMYFDYDHSGTYQSTYEKDNTRLESEHESGDVTFTISQ